MKKTRTEFEQLANAINRERQNSDVLPAELVRLLGPWGIEVESEPILPDITHGEIEIHDTGTGIELTGPNGQFIYHRGYGRGMDMSEATIRANAKLHAAAPEMARVLREIVFMSSVETPEGQADTLHIKRDLLWEGYQILEKAGVKI